MRFDESENCDDEWVTFCLFIGLRYVDNKINQEMETMKVSSFVGSELSNEQMLSIVGGDGPTLIIKTGEGGDIIL